MKKIILIFIIYIQLIVGINELQYKVFMFESEKKIKILSEFQTVSQKKAAIEKIKFKFQPLIKKICEKHKFEIDKEKKIYNNKYLVLPYIKKTHDSIKKFMKEIQEIKFLNSINSVYLFSKSEKTKFYFFLKEMNTFINKFDNEISNIGIHNQYSDDVENFFFRYKNEFMNLLFNLKKFDIKHMYVSVRVFKNEIQESIVNKFNILKKIIKFKIDAPVKDITFDPNINVKFDFLQLNFCPIKNFKTLCLEIQTIKEVKSKYYCEKEIHSFKLADHIFLQFKFIKVIESMYELEKIALEADKFINLLNNNQNKDDRFDKYNKAVNNFKENLLEFFSESHKLCYSENETDRNFSSFIIIKILEVNLYTKKNFRKTVDNLFNLILTNDSFGETQFEKLYNNSIFEDAEKYQEIYSKTYDFWESCNILKTINDNISKSNEKLAYYLNYKKSMIYGIILLIYKCFNSNDPYQCISNLIQGLILDTILGQFFPKCYTNFIHIIFEKHFRYSPSTLVLYDEKNGIVNTLWLLKKDFSTRIYDWIQYFVKNKNINPHELFISKTICMSILIDILKIVSENIIEERDCYLSEWKNDNEIPLSLKEIFILCEKINN